MNCPKCFAEIPENAYHCPECGEKTQGGGGYYQQPAVSSDSIEPVPLMETLTRPFKDPSAMKKLLLGGLVNLIPLAGAILVCGYSVQYARHILRREGDPNTLPDWDGDKMMGYLSGGVFLFVAILIYLLLLGGVSIAVMVPFWGGFAALASLTRDSQDPKILCGAFLALGIPFLIIFCLFMIFAFVSPLITLFYAREQNFGSALDIMGMMGLITRSVGDYIWRFCVLFLIGCLVGPVIAAVNIIPFIGPIIYYFLFNIFVFIIGMVHISCFGEYAYQHME